MKNSLNEKIYSTAAETFEMMCYMFPLEEFEVEETEKMEESGSVVSVVNFDGASHGGMILRASRDLVDAIADNMLGSDDATEEQKHGALCEIANIICGNVVPAFSDGEEISYIRPPRIAAPGEQPHSLFDSMNHSETVRIHLDEGSAEISVYYS
ncbi:chemotaxis protein CheX [Natronogracilivirga saccharolytica]|uniref:Chemotaxis protein CheX n=1 Tax=Natronogracilivirga saccharolytica TaxID=2812953 RepID=A0A8J7UUX5_9BACT|nr:chemotaxis protein CheX [Natronogracilivirga saccharolytica]MBP3191926.1 chemotaxis protein CheX [Natronogracilivirga saccharolytica]